MPAPAHPHAAAGSPCGSAWRALPQALTWALTGVAWACAAPAWAAGALGEPVVERRDAPDPEPASAALGRKGGQPFGAEAAAAPTLSPRAAEALRRINGYRAAGATCGTRRFDPAPPLTWSATLESAADMHARDMAIRRQMSHAGSDGSSVGQRASRLGYAWTTVGENVSAGYQTEAEALAGWMSSPGHCSNMMSAAFSEVGVAGAHAATDSFGWYRAMVLGRPQAAAGGADGLARLAAAVQTVVLPQAVLEPLNRLRSDTGRCGQPAQPAAPPLAWDERLARAAQMQARDNARRGSADSTGLDGSTIGQRTTRAGFVWSLVGELVISARPHAEASLAHWMADAGSCRMLGDAAYTHVGLAGAAPDSATQDPYWVLVLARLGAP